MKKQFSINWNKSRQPRKQRKFLANAPIHIKRKIISAHLSKQLREKYQKRAFEIRKGDEAIIKSGKFKGKKGKISLVDLRRMKVAIEGIQITKKEGSKINLYFNPSKLLIIELNLDDKKRLESLKRKNEILTKAENKISEIKKETKTEVKK